MKDIDLAKQILKEENQSLVVVKNGEVLYKSRDRGIKPMYSITKEMKEEVHGSSIADKVIGKGAALLCANLNIAEVYGDLMSKDMMNFVSILKIEKAQIIVQLKSYQ